MTRERQNEIWAMLDNEEQGSLSRAYAYNKRPKELNDGFRDALDIVFGKHNLTAQAEENCTNPTENGILGSKIQSESAESVETSTKEDAYFAYRLDLAKKIAVAMIGSNYSTTLSFDNYQCAKDVVNLTNEIVKRLKETEE